MHAYAVRGVSLAPDALTKLITLWDTVTWSSTIITAEEITRTFKVIVVAAGNPTDAEIRERYAVAYLSELTIIIRVAIGCLVKRAIAPVADRWINTVTRVRITD